MDESLVIALMITVIGMSLLFLSLVFFYGMLSLLARIKDKDQTPDSVGPEALDATMPEGTAFIGDELGTGQAALHQAVAIAVALARAEAELEPGPGDTLLAPAPAAGGEQVSAWWSLYHQRQLAHRSANPDTRRDP